MNEIAKLRTQLERLEGEGNAQNQSFSDQLPRRSFQWDNRIVEKFDRMENEEAKDFLRLVAMFPLLPVQEYDGIYQSVYKKFAKSGFEDLLPIVSIYADVINWREQKLVKIATETLRQEVLQFLDEDCGKISYDTLLELMDNPLTRLDATNWLRRLVCSPNIDASDALRRKFQSTCSPYKRHMLARIVSDTVGSGKSLDNAFDLFHACLEEGRYTSDDAAFLLKNLFAISKDLARSVIEKLLETNPRECVTNLIIALSRYIRQRDQFLRFDRYTPINSCQDAVSRLGTAPATDRGHSCGLEKHDRS